MFKLIKKLDELAQSLNAEKNIIQGYIEQLNEGLKLLNSNEEYNPVLRKLYDTRLLKDLHVNFEKQNNAIKTLLIKTEELERLYDKGKDVKKKKNFLGSKLFK